LEMVVLVTLLPNLTLPANSAVMGLAEFAMSVVSTMPSGVMTFVGRLERAQGIEPRQAPWPLDSYAQNVALNIALSALSALC
jgi:hypothetical protein